jgi:hypothetical protein
MTTSRKTTTTCRCAWHSCAWCGVQPDVVSGAWASAQTFYMHYSRFTILQGEQVDDDEGYDDPYGDDDGADQAYM